MAIRYAERLQVGRFVVKREVFDIIGEMDSKFRFWYADNDYAKTLKKYKIRHALVSSSIVDHLESETLHQKTTFEQWRLMEGDKFYFKYKWGEMSFLSYLSQTLLLRIKMKIFSVLKSLLKIIN